jgi:hypothetical protein
MGTYDLTLLGQVLGEKGLSLVIDTVVGNNIALEVLPDVTSKYFYHTIFSNRISIMSRLRIQKIQFVVSYFDSPVSFSCSSSS